MRFSLNFIKEFVDISIEPKELAKRLTLLGMEVERLQALFGDWVFDIEVTPNRYDWLSHLGIAREISACLGRRLKLPVPAVKRRPAFKDKQIIIKDTKDCLLYIGRVVTGVKVGPSPAWLKERVTNCGMSSVNSIVDITNYCMLKWGNPMHAFDMDKIEGDIYIRRARKGESFLAIDGRERALSGDNLVICDSRKIIALAGVMGAKNTEVTNSTQNIFLEAAVFSPLTVRISRRRCGLDTESSYRFERKVNPAYLDFASFNAASLCERIAKGKLSGYKAAGKNHSFKVNKIKIDLSKMNDYMGHTFSAPYVRKILTNLGFKVDKKSSDEIVVFSPEFRFDIERAVDIYEEVGRMYGYGNIKPSLFSMPPSPIEDGLYEFKNELRKLLCSAGLREAITFSIESEAELNRFAFKDALRLNNPLRKQENTLRPTLLLGMLEAVKHNINRGQNEVGFFEVADVYRKVKSGFKEIPKAGISLTGKKDIFFSLKGIVENIISYFGLEHIEFKEADVKNFEGSLNFFVYGKNLGFLGRVDRDIKKYFSIKESVFYCEIDLEALKKFVREKTYIPFSIYPPVSRDISIALSKAKKFDSVKRIITDAAGGYLSDLELIGFYQGNIPKGYSAFTLRVLYQSKERTLTSKEVDSFHNEARNRLSKEEGIVLR